MAAFQKFNDFVSALDNGIHNFSTHVLKVALSNTLPVAGNSVLTDIVEISYTNLSARVLTLVSSGQTLGLYKLILANLTLTASGVVPAFRYIIIYNDTAVAKNLIGFVDNGAVVNMINTETFLIKPSPTNGVLQVQ